MENLENQKGPVMNEGLGQSPKILEYMERVKRGEAIESFGDIPESWKEEISKGLQNVSKEETLIVSENTTERDEKIENIKKDIYELSESGGHESVDDHVFRDYLLDKVNETFTKEVARQVARENIEKASGKDLYKIMLEQLYRDTRVGTEYDRTNKLFNIDVEALTRESNYLIKRVQDENGWHYRIPMTATTANKSENRISLNVWGNKELVDKLDKLAYKYGIYYKTPAQSDSWNERNDPVTIYINNPNLTKEQLEELKQEVIQETSSYIRSNEGFGIYGDNIAPGVEFGPESSLDEIQRLKQEAQKISPELAQAFDEYLRRDGKEKSSVGMNLAAQKLLHMFN